MNFSDCIEHTGGVIEYSPDGRLVAVSRAFDVYVSKQLFTSISIPLLIEVLTFSLLTTYAGIRDRDIASTLAFLVPRSNLVHNLVCRLEPDPYWYQ